MRKILIATSNRGKLREITAEHGILLVVDEVQTGFGRTGRMLALEHTPVEPDILLLAKGIASGMTLSGMVARRDLMETSDVECH